MRSRRLGAALRIAAGIALVAASATAIPGAAVAQGASPKVSAKLSSSRVEVGEPFTFEVRVTTQGSDAQPYQISLPAGLQQVGQSVMQGGGSTRQLIVSFQIVAERPGRYTIPGPMVQWNGQRLSGSPATLEVVPSTGRRSSPFMLPGGITMRFGSGDDDDDVPVEKDSPELALPSAPDSQLFLHAFADKKTAVIGEQVTVTLYAYFNASFRPEESHEAPFNDFRTVSLIQDSGTQQGVLYARAGKERFHVKVLGRVAAFPLRAGVLHTGTAKMKLASFRAGVSTERVSNDETITVTEPPLDYRPLGYRLGDVGQFTLQAIVQSRRIDEGGSVPVLVTVNGAGSFPDSIRLPDRTGLEWLDPEKKENLQVRDGTVAGSRSFGYVVRVKETGSVDLGAVSFSYWNPSAHRYETAKADLGKVEVAPTGLGVGPSAKPVASADPAAVDPFIGLSTARMTLGAYSPARAPVWGEGFTLWGLLAAPPLLVLGAFAGSQGVRKARERRAAGAESRTALAEKALAEAAIAEGAGDMQALAAALSRAIHLAVEGATGLRSRGVLIDDLPGELEPLGVAPDVAEGVRAALLACESIRFDPDGALAAHDLGERARALVRELAQTTSAST